MMGLAGTVVGASVVGMVGVVRSIAETWFPGMVANADHKHQMKIHLQSQRYEAETAAVRVGSRTGCLPAVGGRTSRYSCA